jgi:hypothetical protein
MRLIKRVFKKSTSLGRFIDYRVNKITREILKDKEIQFKKQLKNIKESHKKYDEFIVNKHKLELEEKDKAKESEIDRLHTEFELQFKKLKDSYLISNVDAIEAREAYDEGISHIHSLEKEFSNIVNQLDHRNDFLTDKVKELLGVIVRSKNIQQDLIKNFEKFKDLHKEKISKSMYRKKKPKKFFSLKPNEFKQLSSDTPKENFQ